MTGHNFKLEKFEGPLDLLLFLIKKNEVNIYDIPISEITSQYLEYLKYTEVLDLDNVSAFHATAAMLLYIKSRTLLPIKMDTTDDIDPRQELVERLIEYQKFKRLSLLMEEQEERTEYINERKSIQRMLPFAENEVWDNINIWDLLNTFSLLMRRLPGDTIIDLYEEISVNEKLALLLEILENKSECIFPDLIIRSGSIMDIICAFLAILDAGKNRIITISQNRVFGDIILQPHISGTAA